MVELIVAGIAALIGVAMEAAITAIVSVFGFNYETFVDAFPFAGAAFTIIQSASLGIVLLAAALQLLPFLANATQSRSTPFRIILGAAMGVAGIYYGNYLLDIIMGLAEMPYNAMITATYAGNVVAGFDGSDMGWGIIATFLSDIFQGASVLLYLIALLMMGFAFIKLLLEAVERYVILFVLVYLSPLAFSMLASETTSGIFKRFMSMFIGQCVLLVVNAWSLQMVASMFFSVSLSGTKLLTLLVGYAFIRIASRMDSYLNALGVNAAVTGAGLGAEIMATGMAIMASSSGTFGAMGKAGAGKSGGILGASQAMSGFVGKYSPISAGGNWAKDQMASRAKSGSNALAAAADVRNHGGTLKDQFAAFRSTFAANQTTDSHDAEIQSLDGNVWRRSTADDTQSGIGTIDYTTNAFRQDPTKAGDTRLNDIRNSPKLADYALGAIPDKGGFDDPAVYNATLEGTGAGATEIGASALAASKGDLPSENLIRNYSRSDGFKQEWQDKQGAHTFEQKDYRQWNSLPASEKAKYTPFKNSNGTTYYQRMTTTKPPTQVEQNKAALQSTIASFVANPSGAVLNRSVGELGTQAQYRKETMPEIQRGMAENNTSFEYRGSTGDKETAGAFIEMVADYGRSYGMSSKEVAEMRTAFQNPDSDFSLNADGTQVDIRYATEDGGSKQIMMVTPQGASKHGQDESNLSNKGYRSVNFGDGNVFMRAKASKNSLEAAHNSGEFDTFVHKK